jgi:uncharacterized lipoprotein YajG
MRMARAGRRLTSGGLGAALAVSAVLLAACGGDNEEPRKTPKPPQLTSAGVIDSDPYAIACGHVRDQQKWADVTRRATVAIADRERIARLNRLQATQSLFLAMTELCKGSPASHEPARAAVQAVRQGKYRVDLSAP